MRRLIPAIFLLVWTSSAGAEASGALTLRQAYEKALAQSESLAIQEQTIRIAEAHYLQALGTVLPHINVVASEFIQDTSGSSSSSSGGTSVSNTFISRSRPQVGVALVQPLFQGFREFRALRVANAEKLQNTYRTERARQILFSDVARAYYTVLQVERQLDIQNSLRGTLLKRTQELKDRIGLGKSRPSELLTTESQLASTEADLENTKGLVATARDFLGFLTGEPATQRLRDEFQVPGRVSSLERYTESLDQRPDLMASKQTVRLAKGQWDYQKGGRYPNANVQANYYFYRTGFQKDIHWDTTFNLNIPIFQGGATRGLIREAEAKYHQATLGDQETDRQAQTDLRQAYDGLKSSQAQDFALRRAEQKASASFIAQQEEYRLGLVNNLDVLQALRDWQQSRLQSNQSYFATKLNYLNVLVASGQLPPPQNGEDAP